MHSVINWSNDIFIIHSKWTDISWIQEVLREESRIAYQTSISARNSPFVQLKKAFPSTLLLWVTFSCFHRPKKRKTDFLYNLASNIESQSSEKMYILTLKCTFLAKIHC